MFAFCRTQHPIGDIHRFFYYLERLSEVRSLFHLSSIFETSAILGILLSINIMIPYIRFFQFVSSFMKKTKNVSQDLKTCSHLRQAVLINQESIVEYIFVDENAWTWKNSLLHKSSRRIFKMFAYCRVISIHENRRSISQ